MSESTLNWRRHLVLWTTLLMVCALLTVSPVLSQAGSRVLVAGTTVSDSLGPDNGAVSYVFDAAANATASVAFGNLSGGALAVHISDINGNTVVQARSDQAPGASFAVEALLTSGGRYTVLIYSAPGSDIQETTFDITLSLADSAGAAEADSQSAAAEIPELILLAGGVQVELTWNGAADLNLEVRDPSGESLHWDSRTTNNGGVFGFDANGLCQVISGSPTETATWQPGFLPTGSYEVLVYYEQACDTLTATVEFTVNVTVNGVASGTISSLLAPFGQTGQNVYVGRFEVDGDGGATVNAGGIYPASSLTLLPASYAADSDVPTPIVRDVPIVGTIGNAQPFVTYAFTGTANELVSVDMQAIGANLDTLLQIIDPAGNVVNVNDDSVLGGTTNSLIANARLLSSGTYTILASRYGKDIGGTEGQFQLTLSGPSSEFAVQQTAFSLPQGDIAVSLYWSTSADLQLLVRDPGGQSVFDDNPVVASGGILQEAGNVNCILAASGAPVSYIYWPAGRMRPGTYEVEVWYQDACSELPPPVDFTLLIEVGGQLVSDAIQFPQVGQRFVTNFTVQPSGQGVAGAGGFIDGGSATLAYQAEAFDAPEIESGRPVTGIITADNAFDAYQFAGSAGESVTISMSAATQTLDTNVYLISPSQIEVAANDDGDPVVLGSTGRPTNSLISGFVLPENGPYTIIATRFGNQYGGTIGAYELTMRKN